MWDSIRILFWVVDVASKNNFDNLRVSLSDYLILDLGANSLLNNAFWYQLVWNK